MACRKLALAWQLERNCEVTCRLAWADWFVFVPSFTSHIMQAIWFPPVLPTHYPIALGGGPIPLSLRCPLDAIPEIDASFIDEAEMCNIRHGPTPPLARRLECITVPPPPLQTLDGIIPPPPVRSPPRPWIRVIDGGFIKLCVCCLNKRMLILSSWMLVGSGLRRSRTSWLVL